MSSSKSILNRSSSALTKCVSNEKCKTETNIITCQTKKNKNKKEKVKQSSNVCRKNQNYTAHETKDKILTCNAIFYCCFYNHMNQYKRKSKAQTFIQHISPQTHKNCQTQSKTHSNVNCEPKHTSKQNKNKNKNKIKMIECT